MPSKVRYHCSFPNCINGSYVRISHTGRTKPHFFRFPIDLIARQEWFEIIWPDGNYPIIKSPFLCGNHFEDKSFTSTFRNRLLKFAKPVRNNVFPQTINILKEHDYFIKPEICDEFLVPKTEVNPFLSKIDNMRSEIEENPFLNKLDNIMIAANVDKFHDEQNTIDSNISQVMENPFLNKLDNIMIFGNVDQFHEEQNINDSNITDDPFLNKAENIILNDLDNIMISSNGNEFHDFENRPNFETKPPDAEHLMSTKIRQHRSTINILKKTSLKTKKRVTENEFYNIGLKNYQNSGPAPSNRISLRNWN